MRTYTIIKKPDVLEWSKIPVAFIENSYHKGDVGISSFAQVCYDDTALYVRLYTTETNIRAVGTGPLDAPCEDSCMEFFFSPINGDSRYLNIEFNPNCCVYFGIGSCVQDLVRLIPEEGFPLNPKATITDAGWEITYEIPYSFIRRFFPEFSPSSGDRIRGNFYKCGDLTEKEHYFTWNPLSGDVLSFHRPCDFGLLHFE